MVMYIYCYDFIRQLCVNSLLVVPFTREIVIVLCFIFNLCRQLIYFLKFV